MIESFKKGGWGGCKAECQGSVLSSGAKLLRDFRQLVSWWFSALPSEEWGSCLDQSLGSLQMTFEILRPPVHLCALPFTSIPDHRVRKESVLSAASCVLMTAVGFYGRGLCGLARLPGRGSI